MKLADGTCKQQQVVSVSCNNPCKEGDSNVCFPIRTDQSASVLERDCPAGVSNPCETTDEELKENICSHYEAGKKLEEARKECGDNGGGFIFSGNTPNFYCDCLRKCATYTHDGVDLGQDILLSSAQEYCRPGGQGANTFASTQVMGKTHAFTCSCTSPPPPTMPPPPADKKFITADHVIPDFQLNRLIDKLHAPHLDIAYTYGDDCLPEEKNNDEAVTAAIGKALRTWLQPLRDHSDKPIVADFLYRRVAFLRPHDEDLGITFHCLQKVSVVWGSAPSSLSPAILQVDNCNLGVLAT